jgi:hypothetical protein
VLLFPVVSLWRASNPNALSLVPVGLLDRAPVPNAVFVCALAGSTATTPVTAIAKAAVSVKRILLSQYPLHLRRTMLFLPFLTYFSFGISHKSEPAILRRTKESPLGIVVESPDRSSGCNKIIDNIEIGSDVTRPRPR